MSQNTRHAHLYTQTNVNAYVSIPLHRSYKVMKREEIAARVPMARGELFFAGGRGGVLLVAVVSTRLTIPTALQSSGS